MNKMKQKLYKSKKDKIFAGVVGGIGEYFEIDSTLLRLIWALVVVFTGIFPGVIVYLIAWAIMPEKPGSTSDPDVKIAEENQNNL